MGLHYFLNHKKEDLYKNVQEVYKSDDRPWVVGFSGGKDSTVVVQIIFYALSSMSKNELTKPVYIISSDTMVENPKILEHIDTQLLKMKKAANELELPIHVEKVMPNITNTFWVNLIGRGYPAPRQKFRWCTDRLKIDPANNFILNKVSEFGETVVVLGVRKSESSTRAQVMNTHKVEGKILRRHTKLPNSYVYAPIEDFSLDDVWTYLMQVPNPWGADNADLLALYQDSQGECPLVIDNSTPSCGNSRFGCWVCTVVQEDKSLKGFIESGDEWLTPLLKFRNWLLENRDKEDYREKKRANGSVYLIGDEDNKRLGLGPYTLEHRKEILRKLLETEKQLQHPHQPKYELITIEELKEIRKIWFEKGDWEDSVLAIYEEVYGHRPNWDIEESKFLESEDIKLLKKLCHEEEVEFELVQKLVNLEFQHYGYKHRYGILKDINRILNEEWLHFDQLQQGDNYAD
ncbi:DNA phosphorothioation system sulfurtransferase DndC [Geobacillus thermoleovorans]|uniref:DNA phosphorothioation system sulfurtransferase DndC n=1 Tax=Geobacillus TaxID=129337 RepID=UPI000697FC24|nr:MULTISPECIES: DNA phosphorothioation system sulfurtransferase DndC [Geobacillus]KQB91443.1 sulfurtransferase [Geobacillus sp. PA-3]TRY39408.1 DNA phosphorothioation system sulfurtransferase DndC [Geobacillus sp. LEMMJ02]UPT59741.1 DNA phosphorothioation system sulfurtransferase DndC [Geobacillus thermoleovorans]